MTDFQTQSARLTAWCKDHALPLWGTKGVDPSGGFWESIGMDASPDHDALRRVRVQARQCYVFAHAAHMGWYDDAKAVANHGWDYLTTQGLQGGEDIAGGDFAGCAHLLNPDGSLHDGWRDTYAQAFIILASSWRYRAFDNSAAKAMLYDTLNFLNTHVKADNAGWCEGIPAPAPRRQNPHMHLFEAFLAAYEATQDQSFMDHADHIFGMFTDHFFEPKTQTLLEFFEQDWSPDAKTGDLTEPGHAMEWAWLIHWYARLSGNDAAKYAEKLYQAGVKMGTNPKTGLIINECTIDGRITKGESRLWPQTEYIKANVARARAGHKDGYDNAAQMIDKMFHYYLDTPVMGGWHDQRDADGVITSHNMSSSTFYHIFCCAAEAQYLADLA